MSSWAGSGPQATRWAFLSQRNLLVGHSSRRRTAWSQEGGTAQHVQAVHRGRAGSLCDNARHVQREEGGRILAPGKGTSEVLSRRRTSDLHYWTWREGHPGAYMPQVAQAGSGAVHRAVAWAEEEEGAACHKAWPSGQQTLGT